MVVILGTGALHDALLAAALRGCGIDAEAAEAPTDEALALGRALMPRGHPCSVYYLAGTMVLHARTRPGAHCFVTPGDRCGSYATDLQRALHASGATSATVLAPSPERGYAALDELLSGARGLVWQAALDAMAAGDALCAAGRRLRARSADPDEVDRRVREAIRSVTEALECGGDTVQAIRSHAPSLRPGRGSHSPRLRVRVTGELLPAMSSGDPGARLVRWMESRGAEVETPLACEWAMHQAWRASRCDGELARVRAMILDAWERHAAATGQALSAPVDASAWVEAAQEWVPVSLCSGAGFTEIAVYLDVERSRRAELVVSIKPFASIPSSSTSDAVLHALSRRGPVGFLSLEVNGDGHTQMRSRLELAMDFAQRREGIGRS